MATTKVKSETKAPAAKAAQAKSSATATKKATTARSAASKPSSAKAKSSKSLSTTNHDEIRAWVEKRKGTPSTVKATAKGDTGILRIDFPGYSGKDTLEAISWDDFFKKFDESNVEFLYQNETAAGKESRFNKFVAKK